MPVIDWRTNIHGIKEEDMVCVKFTLRNAQAFLLDICHDKTIIIGHAVNFDLQALRIAHRYEEGSYNSCFLT